MIENFTPVPRPRLGKEKQPPKNFQVRITDNEISNKFHEYCLKNNISGTEVIMQLIKKLVE